LAFASPRVWVLPSDATAAGVARRHVDGVCAGLPTEKVDVARLLVTELVTNALRHGAGTVTLGIARDGVSLTIHVEDESPEMPVVLQLTDLREHGAGMRLVAALASSWGVDLRPDGKTGKRVWFVVA
jgi:anti-sigma regulatory factor (Ser/Thr protein kinase)